MLTPDVNQIGTLVVSYIVEREGAFAAACLSDFKDAMAAAEDKAEKLRISLAWLELYTRDETEIARGL